MFRIINVIFASIFFLYHQGISQTQTLNSAPTFLQFSYTTGNILEVAPSASAIISSVTQSTVATGYTGTVANLTDNSFTTGARTSSAVNASITIDLGTAKRLNYVDLAALNATYLNGRALQLSSDGTNYITVISSITGATNTGLVRYSFTSQSVRFIRIQASTSTAQIIDLAEFRIEGMTYQLIAGGSASGLSTVQNLPFSFNFYDKGYNQFSVAADGFLRFGNSVAKLEASNSYTTTTNGDKVFGWWDDIATATTNNGGGVSFWISGTAPNRKAVINWVCTNSTTSGIANLQFQIILNETSHKIELVYGAGTPSTSASIGWTGSMNTWSTTAKNTQFASITTSANLNNTKLSYFTPNNSINIWPGNGTAFVLSRTNISNQIRIPSGGTGNIINLPSLDNALGIINWAGLPPNGTTITINNGYTETVPVGFDITLKNSGLLVTAASSSTKPLIIQNDGGNTKPVLFANTGIGSNDYILAFTGNDYVTIDGLDLQENNTNTISPTNTKWTEYGLVFFKKQLGSSTIGANGCQNNIIRNCNVQLDKRTNGSINIIGYFDGSGNYYSNLPMYSRGIAFVYWEPLQSGITNYEYIVGDCLSTGIVTTTDVHSNNEIIGNTISNAFYGIYFEDRYKTNGDISARGNVIGKSGAGNIISNFGANAGTSYSISNYWNLTSIGSAKGIFIGGCRDADIQYNTIQNGNASANGIYGIYFGTMERGINGTKTIGNVIIANNTITNLTSQYGGPATDKSDVTGIGFITGNPWNRKQIAIGDLSISNNIINNLLGIAGRVIGISSGSYYSTSSNISYNEFSLINGPGKTSTLNGNSISDLKAKGLNASFIEHLAGIYWGGNYSTSLFNNNEIRKMELGDGNSSPNSDGSADTYSYMTGIGFITSNTGAVRSLMEITGNTIAQNISKSNGTKILVQAKLIHARSGGTTTRINGNTIEKNDIAGSYDKSNTVEDGITMIHVQAAHSAGTGEVWVQNNSLANNTRRKTVGGSYALLNGIFLANTTLSQKQFIRFNNIDGLISIDTLTTATTVHIISGIRSTGNATKTTCFIDSNKISGLLGYDLRSNQTIANSGGSAEEWRYFTNRGIVATNHMASSIRKNLIHGNSIASPSAGTGTTYLEGVIGILSVGGTIGKTHSINNNFVYDLSAPAYNNPIALTGIHIAKSGKFFVDHNTIVIGNPITASNNVPTAVTSTATGAFGVSGISYSASSISTKRTLTNEDQYTFRNNIIALEADAKGTGSVIALRQMIVSTANALPGDITNSTNGNVYYTKAGTWNYLYGQGTISNTTGGLRNCFAINGGTTNTTNNLVVNNDFNTFCSKYEKFMRGADASSFADVVGTGTGMVAVPVPFAGGTGNPSKYYPTTNSSSYAFNSFKALAGVEIKDDYSLVDIRTNLKTTAGAYQTTGTILAPKSTLSIDVTPVENIICTNNITIIANIQYAFSNVAVSTVMKPRLYYKLTGNTNQMPGGVSQNTNTFNGWKYVEPSSISNDQYSFIMDLSKINLHSGVTTLVGQTIEYFFVFADNAGTGTQTYAISGTSTNTCITNTDLFISGGNTATGCVPEIEDATSSTTKTVSTNFKIIDATTLTKKIFVSADNQIYSSSSAVINSYTGGKITLKAIYELSGANFPSSNYIIEESTSSTFANSTLTSITDPTYEYTMSALHPATRYLRFHLTCNGNTVASNTNTPYIQLSTIGIPSTTSSSNDITKCIDETITTSISNDNTSSTARYYFVSDPTGKTYLSNQTLSTSSTSGSIQTVLSNADQSGTWSAGVAVNKLSITNGGFLQSELASNPDNQQSGITHGTGMAFETTDFVKINSIKLFDDTQDGAATTNFKIVLYNNNGFKLYETTSLNITNGASTTINFSNWYIGAGKYNMVIENSTDNTPVSGLLLSPSNTALPYTIGSTLTLIGGTKENDYTTAEQNSYTYFLDWNVTCFVTKSLDNFSVKVSEKQTFACAPSLWLKTDEGLSYSSSTLNSGVVTNGQVSSWEDQSGRFNIVNQITQNNQPTSEFLTTKMGNFNPVMLFNGTSQLLDASSTSSASGTSARSYFVVADPASNNIKPVLSHGTTTSFLEFQLSDDKIGAAISSSVSNQFAYTSSLPNNADANAPKLATFLSGNMGQFKDIQFLINGKRIGNTSTSTTTLNITNSNTYIGRNAATTATFFDNRMFEILSYPDTLDFEERNKILSYLAIKWGITLDQSYDNDNDETLGTSYTSSNGEIIWSSARNPNFNYDIFGIGRDDVSGLHQRQSKSVNPSALITIGNNNIIANSNYTNNDNNIGTNMSFLLLSDNGANLNWTNEGAPSYCSQIIERKWLVQESGNIGSVKIQIPAANSSSLTKLPASVGNIHLLIDNDDDFSEGATFIPMTLNGNNWEINYNLTNGQYIGFGTLEPYMEPTLINGDKVESSDNCMYNGWNYYFNSITNKKTFIAIHSNGNNDYIASNIIYDANRMSSELIKSSGVFETRIMNRLVYINAPGTFSNNGGLKIRFYFSDTEKNNEIDNNTAYVKKGWFKFNGNIDQTLASLTPTGLTATYLTPDSSGVENGVHFVEFRNITSFSTFGYLGTSNANAVLPITVETLNAQRLDCNSARVSWKLGTPVIGTTVILERSLSTSNSFEPITNIDSVTQVGQYLDKNLKSGGYLYRIHLITPTGLSIYSKSVLVQVNCYEDKLSINPNPVKSTINVSYLTGESNLITIRLYNNSGILLHTEKKQVKNGQNTFTLENDSNLINGTYLIELITPNGKAIYTRFIILR